MHKIKRKMKTIYTTLFVIACTIVMLLANQFLQNIEINLHNNAFTNGIFKYQIFLLLLALITLFITIKITPESKKLLRIGNLKNIATKETWLGINGKTSWKSNAIQLLFIISIATGIFMFLATQQNNSLANFEWWYIPFILLFSLTNSFSEEIIFRFTVNGNLTNNSSKRTILILSAFLFGLPHYFGFPSGIIGVIMAGVLGYVLSKATYETKGLAIAWTIHFVQDIIIFTALFMMNLTN